MLGIIALFACGFVADTLCGIFDKTPSDDNLLAPAETELTIGSDDRLNKKIDGESFTWLWIVSDYRPDVFDDYYPSDEKVASKLTDFGVLGKEYRYPTASNIILVRAFVDTREYIIMTIPSITRITTAEGDYTLGDYYGVAGTEGLREKVGSMTGLDITYCSVIHSTDLSKLASTVGSIECTLPVAIYTDGKNYVSAPVVETTSDETDKKETSKKKEETTKADEPEYKKELDRSDSVKLAKKLMAALLYYDPSDGIQQEMTIEQSFAQGLLTNLSESSDTTLQSMLTGLSKTFVFSDVKNEAVYLHGEVIRAYSWFEVRTATYPGKLIVGKGDKASYYRPNTEEAVKLFYDYR